MFQAGRKLNAENILSKNIFSGSDNRKTLLEIKFFVNRSEFCQIFLTLTAVVRWNQVAH